MLKGLTRLLGDSNEGAIKRLRPTVEEINGMEPEIESLSDAQLRAETDKYRALIRDGESSEDLLPEAFAAVREAAKRTLGQRHFDVQLMGGIVLFQGKVAEMRTGEGKTLVATLPAYLQSLTGSGVHVVTVNDYLARRDAQWMGAVYDLLGVSVGVLQHESAYVYDPVMGGGGPGLERLRPASRTEAYRSDITYGTNNEFGFDYLRDNMVQDTSQRVQGELGYAIVDEVDNILIDEARTPLIISGPAQKPPSEYQKYARVVPGLQLGEHYTIDEKHRSAALTNDGISRLERQLSVRNLYAPENFDVVHYVENALKAQAIFQRDRAYVVKDGEVVIVDEFTGRLMQGRRFSDGLHQALEAKEGVQVRRESITYATITLQNYFRMYSRLAGMTGTAATEAEELFKIYKLEVVEVPTNRPMVRRDWPDQIYRDERSKYNAVVAEIEERHRTGQPILVGTTDIDKSELLSDMLTRKKVPHEVLNAKQHEREATIVAQAGAPGAVTVATNMAGRGTDIVLGGNPEGTDSTTEEWEAAHRRVVELGGLHIIGTERHEARRIDNQLRGRGGRQGDPGSSRFYVGLDDELMRRFGGDRIKGIMDWAGLEDDVPIENKMISKSIEGAQVKVEAFHFDARKHLVEYDDVVNTHRGVIYGERDKALTGADLKANIQAMVENQVRDIVRGHVSGVPPEQWNTEGLLAEVGSVFTPPPELSDPDVVAQMAEEEVEEGMADRAEALYGALEEQLGAETMRVIERQLMLRVIDVNWVQHLTGIDNLRQGIGLHAYGQRDPLVMYKREGHEMFQSLQERIQRDVVQSIYHIGVPQNDGAGGSRGRGRAANGPKSVMGDVAGRRNNESAAPGNRKIGRNKRCPCGSGKKYKRCHGV